MIIEFNNKPCLVLKEHKAIIYASDFRYENFNVLEIIYKNQNLIVKPFDCLYQVYEAGNIEYIHPLSKILGFEEILHGKKSGVSFIYDVRRPHKENGIMDDEYYYISGKKFRKNEEEYYLQSLKAFLNKIKNSK